MERTNDGMPAGTDGMEHIRCCMLPCLSRQTPTPTATDIAPPRAFVHSGSPFSHHTGCTFPLLDDLGFLSETEAAEQILLGTYKISKGMDPYAWKHQGWKHQESR